MKRNMKKELKFMYKFYHGSEFMLLPSSGLDERSLNQVEKIEKHPLVCAFIKEKNGNIGRIYRTNLTTNRENPHKMHRTIFLENDPRHSVSISPIVVQSFNLNDPEEERLFEQLFISCQPYKMKNPISVILTGEMEIHSYRVLYDMPYTREPFLMNTYGKHIDNPLIKSYFHENLAAITKVCDLSFEQRLQIMEKNTVYLKHWAY
jgi:hypothetical protein